MLGLVAKDLHAQPCADTAAYDSQQQKISLRQAGDLLVAGLQLSQKLVQSIGQKRRNIDDQEPQPKESPFGAEKRKNKTVFRRGLHHGLGKTRHHCSLPAFL